jgi:hypothetical protein
MSTAVTTTKPLPPSPLATRHPKTFPQWVLDLNTMVWDETQKAMVYPKATPQQIVAMRNARDQLLEHLEQTPQRFPKLGEELLKALGALTLTKPHPSDAGSLRAEASILSFKQALWDLPAWASLRAVRNWTIGEVGFYDEPEDRYVTKWMPDAGELRQIAKRYMKDVCTRIEVYDKLLHERTALPKPRDPNEDVGGFIPFDDVVKQIEI